MTLPIRITVTAATTVAMIGRAVRNHATKSAIVFSIFWCTEPPPSMTTGNVAGAGVRPVVLCRDCGHQAEPIYSSAALRDQVRGPGVARTIGKLCLQQPRQRHGRRAELKAVRLACVQYARGWLLNC